jgi:hypothetical protein
VGVIWRFRQVTPRLPGVFLPPREEAFLVVAPALREDAVPAPFLAAVPFFFAPVFLAAVFLAGVVCWTAAVPPALQASAIMAAMAT